jgi:uncharacterized membrane protein YidH (DUF202 family)
MPSRDGAPDRALAAERTALGWQRSALTLAVIAGLALSSAVQRGSVVASALAAALLAAAGAVELRGRRLYRARKRGAAPLAPGAVLTLTAFSLAAVAVAVAVTVSGA